MVTVAESCLTFLNALRIWGVGGKVQIILGDPAMRSASDMDPGDRLHLEQKMGHFLFLSVAKRSDC